MADSGSDIYDFEMRFCGYCGGSLDNLIREDTRIFCDSWCRKTAANECNKNRFIDWRNEGRSLVWIDPEADLIHRAPDCAAFYVLSCRNRLGVWLSFPAVGGFRLRQFEPPEVPIKGLYKVTFLDFDQGAPVEVGEIAIGRVTDGVQLPHGGRNRFPAPVATSQGRSSQGAESDKETIPTP